jgi:rhodanese-related sulfurtransferase
MVQTIDRKTVRDLVESRRAQLVEVLPRKEYDWGHLPDAVSLPLKSVTADSAAAALDRSRPVIAYCNDFL